MQLKENSNRELFAKVITAFHIREAFSVVIDFSDFNVFCLFSVFCTHQWVFFCNSHNVGEEDYGEKSLNVIIEMKYRLY